MTDLQGAIFVLVYLSLTVGAGVYLVVSGHPWWAVIPFLMAVSIRYHVDNS